MNKKLLSSYFLSLMVNEASDAVVLSEMALYACYMWSMWSALSQYNSP